MSIIKITRGFEFKYEVQNEFCQLVLKSDTQKICVSNIAVYDGKYYLFATDEETKKFRPNSYKYQILDSTGIIQEGSATVKQNFLLADENESVKSQNEIILEAIQSQLAGIATQAQQSISVGDKSISYMSFTELLQARQFFKKKVAEQKHEHVAGNEGKIKYKWGI